MAGIGSVTVIGWDMYGGEVYQGRSTVQFIAYFNGTISTYSIKVGDEVVVKGNGGLLAPLIKNTCHYLKTDKFSNKYFPKITFTATFGGLFEKKTTETMTLTPNIYVKAYSPPSLSKGVLTRTDSAGLVSDKEKYITAELTYKITSNSGRNKIESVSIYAKSRSLETGSFTLAKTLTSGDSKVTFGGDYDPEQGYDVKIVLKDTIGGVGTYLDFVTTGTVAIELHQNKAAAFGKNVEKFDGLELAEGWNLYTHENVYHDKDVSIGGDIILSGSLKTKDNALYVLDLNKKDMFKVDNLSNGDVVMVKFVAFKNSTYNTVCDDTVLIFRDSQGFMRHTQRNYNPEYEPNYSLYAVENGRVVSFGSTSSYAEKVYYKIYDSVINSKTAKLTLFGTKA